MKDFEKIAIPEEIKIVAQKQIEKQKILWNSITLYKGHTMYEVNCSSGEIKQAEYKEPKVEFVKNIDLITGENMGLVPKIVRDVDCKENCLYIPALNIKSAKKKFLKHFLKTAKVIK